MMTEKQKKLKAERDRRYREKKKLEKAAEADLQAQIDPAPESAMQSPSVMELMEGQEEICNELMRQAPAAEMEQGACMEGSQDGLPPVTPPEKEPKPEPVLEKPLTDFDVYRRRHAGMFR